MYALSIEIFKVRLDGVLGSLSLFGTALAVAGHGAAWALRSLSHSIETVKGQTLFAHSGDEAFFS